MNKSIISIAIETSCDETAITVLRGRFEPLAEIVASQHEIHGKYGGIVPELACRRHAELIRPLVHDALEQAGVGFADLNLVSVTRGPGLVGALLVGLSYAKGLAFGLDLPLVGVNHLEGHVSAAFITQPDLPFPLLALLVSGGHTELFLVQKTGKMKRLGGTRDDAAGEVFDKVAKFLDLGYPGGPPVEKMSAKGEAKYRIPVAMAKSGTPEFSFSGPKTAVKHLIQKLKEENGNSLPIRDICASFQKSIIDALELKTQVAIKSSKPASIAVVGGVACNNALRERMTLLGERLGIPVIIPKPELCSDNATMIGTAGVTMYLDNPESGEWRDYLNMDAKPGWLS
ncbi:N(6)-L-threonylcarbamoyladenine synthase [hydrothermal vent metagenome]|uniref:N(6)-L-threonylcarbamoyladenine synthase n=1 Tax=hydrothermal vent metagenome TaxID=652676 RepID=A0A3B1CDP0_9ZZZZ